MLILTRRIGETLVIGDDEVNFTVLGIKGNQIRLGIDAHESIAVHRREIFLKIKAEGEPGILHANPNKLNNSSTYKTIN